MVNLMDTFVSERNKILKNIDYPGFMINLIHFCKKNNITMPVDSEVILAGLHKARLYVVNEEITEEMKDKSKLWLKEHGYKEDIF